MREGGWKTIARRKIGRLEIRWEDLTSIFVDNLSESTTVEQLSRVFFRFGKLTDFLFLFLAAEVRGSVLVSCVFGRKKRPGMQ